MKKFYSVFISLAALWSIPVYSQETPAEPTIKIDTIADKPASYDSLKNFNSSMKPAEFIQYIGLSVYLPPVGDKYIMQNSGTTWLKDVFFTAPIDSVVSIYQTEYKGVPIVSGSELGNKYYTIKRILLSVDENEDFHGFCLELVADQSSSIIYYSHYKYPNLGPFIFVPYYAKQKELYDGRTVIVTPKEDLKKDSAIYVFKDAVSGKEVEMKANGEWNCKVALLQGHSEFREDKRPTYHYVSDANMAYSISYILKNDKDETVVINNIDSVEFNHIVLLDSFKKNLTKHKRATKILAEKEKIKRESLRKECKEKYGQTFGELISEGRVKLGMTKEMCNKAWGATFYCKQWFESKDIFEDCYYQQGRILHFENGELIRIEQ